MRCWLSGAVMVLALSATARAANLPPVTLEAGEHVITIVGTNDVHGGFETSADKDGSPLGGYAWFAGYVKSIRAHTEAQYGARGQVLLLDAGDAAQGTLLSNYSEGQLAASLMNQVGFDAAVAGNHGFDFGPIGWQEDKVIPGQGGQDTREALNRMIKTANFPFLGANVTRNGQNLHELPPYTLIETFGRRKIAVIGMENPRTKSTTIKENVEDLAFGSGVTELGRVVEDLTKSKAADIFVLVMHEGDGKEKGMQQFLAGLPRRSTGEPLLDAVVAGHTHRVNKSVAGGIPYVQSGANGQHFGMIQLVLKLESGRLSVIRQKTLRQAAIPVLPRESTFLGQPVKQDPKISKMLAEARAQIKDIATRALATATGPLDREGGRTSDCLMGNFLADMMQRISGAPIAMINFGDVRDGLPKGSIDYETFFHAIPKNLRLVVVPKVPVSKLLENIQRSIESCGHRGVLQISGLKLEFKRTCREDEDLDPHAELIKATLADGTVLFQKGRKATKDSVTVATTDFVMEGGAGFPAFQGLPIQAKSWRLRDAIADEMVKLGTLNPADHAVGRYHNLTE
jgi:2',3'-cyclic-nucleotide 2'-phosphodiesterase (5'-nucleotidase family)